ncbi:MAG: hypothetical protein ABI317_09295, partial [Gaiellales bacterium]
EDVPVYAAGGEQVGTVDHVVAVPEVDIFHGIVMRVGRDRRFILAEDVAELHERGVDLRISEADVASLPSPHGGAPVYRDSPPGERPGRWEHLARRMGGRAGLDGWKREE